MAQNPPPGNPGPASPNPPGRNRPPSHPGQSKPDERSRQPNKTKLRLMTSREEKERDFLVAREQFFRKELQSKQREKSHQVFLRWAWDRLVFIIGAVVVIVGYLWFYHHYDEISKEIASWWDGLMASLGWN